MSAGVPVRLRSIPLWGEKWGKEELEAFQAQDDRTYRRIVELEALVDDELWFPSWPKALVHGVSIGELQRNSWPAIVGVDLSGAKRKGNAIVVLKLNPSTRRRHVVEVRRGAWRSHETALQLQQVEELYRPLVFRVENNGYQNAIIEWIQALPGSFDFWAKVEATTTGANKVDATLGLRSLQVEFHNGAWVVPADEFASHPPGHSCPWCVLNREFSTYPQAGEADTVMATWFAKSAAEEYANVIASAASPIGNLRSR